jgi:hypothetical protein
VTAYITTHQVRIGCKDKNSNFGFRLLKFGETYTFSFFFPEFPFPKSLYFCKFLWLNAFHHFDIYVQKRDQGDCGNDCRWIIEESGPCKISDGINCFPWND